MLLSLSKTAFTPSMKFHKVPPDYASSPLPKPKSAASLRNKEVCVCACVRMCI